LFAIERKRPSFDNAGMRSYNGRADLTAARSFHSLYALAVNRQSLPQTNARRGSRWRVEEVNRRPVGFQGDERLR
jgi:hypothetical protein